MKGRTDRSELRLLLPLALFAAALLLPFGAGLLADAAPRPPSVAPGQADDADRPAQGTPGGGGRPDLRWVTEWPSWTYDHRCWNAQRVLTLRVMNRGQTAAGLFAVRDGAVTWFLDGLGAGQTVTLADWGRYPAFPLVIDPFDQVLEANEGNNQLGPRPGETWTPTPRFAERAASTRGPAERESFGAVPPAALEPQRLLTRPPDCPTRTPVPTLTPAGAPSLPDLQVVDASWDEVAIVRQDEFCRPEQGGWTYALTLRNAGPVAALGFTVRSVDLPAAAWRVERLEPGQELTLPAQLRSLPGPIQVDADDDIQESREDNNAWIPPFNGTPTPALTPAPTLPLCLPTLTPTPIPTDALPDLRMERLVWYRADWNRPACLGPLRQLAITVHNAGRSPSGPFEVRAGQHVWYYDSLAPDEARQDQAGPVNRVTWPIILDDLDQVPESDEANNLVTPDRTLTATPTGTPPPTCSPTPQATTPVPPFPTRPSHTPGTPASPAPSPVLPRERLHLPWARG